MKIRDIAIIGIMSAILVTVQIALGFLPNIELVSLLIIIYTVILGRKTLYIIYIFVAVEGLLFGIGLWWINYLYLWTILFLISTLFRKQRSPLIWAMISGFFGLSFGALCAIPNLFLSGIGSAVSYWIAGIPYDLLHGVGNFAVALLLFQPISYVMERINQKLI